MKVLVPLGPAAEALVDGLPNVISIDQLEAGYDFANQEFMFIVDAESKLDAKFLKWSISEIEGLCDCNFYATILVPEDGALSYLPLSPAIEGCKLTILLEK